MTVTDNVEKKKYRWLSSNPEYNYDNGTRAYSWVHVTGDTGSKTACIIEGGLKGNDNSEVVGKFVACR